MDQLIALVREYSNSINNGRTVKTIFEALKAETDELNNEVVTNGTGLDGIEGEAVDVILCALNIIFKVNPGMSDDQIVEYARKKCDKWAKKYS